MWDEIKKHAEEMKNAKPSLFEDGLSKEEKELTKTKDFTDFMFRLAVNMADAP